MKNVEEKLAEASKLIKEAAKQFEKVGLELSFVITIKAQLPIMGWGPPDKPGENTPPLK